MARKPVDAFTTYSTITEEIADGRLDRDDPKVQIDLAEATSALVQQCSDVLGPVLLIPNAHLEPLVEGTVNLSTVIRETKFDFNLKGKQAMLTTELFSFVAENVEGDVALAQQILAAIAKSKIAAGALLGEVLHSDDSSISLEVVSGESVTAHALSLRRDRTALTTYLASGIPTELAADAIYELAVVDPALVRQVLDELPHAVIESMTIGHATMGKSGMLSLISAETFADLVVAQAKNDAGRQQSEDVFTDMNNMTAATLIMEMIDVHAEPHAMLAALIVENEELLEKIIKSKATGGDEDTAKESRKKLAEYWEENKADIRDLARQLIKEQAAAEELAETDDSERAAPVVVAPVVNLDEEIDLDSI